MTIVKHLPSLTPEQVQESFQRRFDSIYTISTGLKITNTDFVVLHSGWSGISVKLRQRDGETAILTKAVIPSFFYRMLVGGFIGFIPYVLFGGYSKGLNMEKEAIEYIKTAPLLNQN